MAPTSSVVWAAALAALCSSLALADSGSGKQPARQSLRGASKWGDDDYDDYDRYHDHDRYGDDRYHDHDDYHRGNDGQFDWRDLLPHTSSFASWGDDGYDDYDRYHDHDRYDDDRYHDHDDYRRGNDGHFDWRDLLPHTSSLASWGDDDYHHDHYHGHDRYHDHDDYGRGYNDHGHTGDWRDLLPHANAGDAPIDMGLPDNHDGQHHNYGWEANHRHHYSHPHSSVAGAAAAEEELAANSLVDADAGADVEWPIGGGHGWGRHGHRGHGHGWGRRHHGHGWGHHHHHGWYSLETLGRDISNSSHMNNSEFWTAIFEDKGLSEAFAGGLSKMNAAARSSWEQDLVAALDWDDQIEREAEQEAHEAKRDIEHVGDRIDRAWDNLAASGDIGDQVEHEAEQEAHEAKHAVDSLAASGDIGDQVEHEAEQEAHEAKQAVDNLAASPETRFWDEVFGDDSSRHSLAAWLVQMGDSQRSEWQQRVSLLATQQGGEAWQPSWGEALQKLAAAQSLAAGGWGWGHHHHHHHHGHRWGGWGGHHGHYHHHHHHHGWYSLPEETASEKKVDEGAGRRLNLLV